MNVILRPKAEGSKKILRAAKAALRMTGERRLHMFGLGMPELLVILLIALLIFGAARLPQIGKALGKTISEFKKGIKEGEPEKENKQEDKKEK